MNHAIHVQVLNRGCAAGDAYAANHVGETLKAAVVSCEGACLKGEIARRAANRIAHELAPERAVRICHGGAFLLTQGGMRQLVEQASQVIVVDGCPLTCGTRVAKAAFPEKKLDVVVATTLYEGDEAQFGVNECTEEDIQVKVRDVADQIVARHLSGRPTCSEAASPTACGTTV